MNQDSRKITLAALGQLAVPVCTVCAGPPCQGVFSQVL